YLAQIAPERVKLKEYGRTNEGRKLLLAYVSNASNIANLESIRTEHLKSTSGDSKADKAIVWLSYNVHGNESVSTEASMQTIYELLTSKKAYLENTVLIMDPCINPDGRDRYVNFYNQFKNSPNNVDPNSKEHREGWWSGRSNHYMFDLNRDWAWLTQVESQQRIQMYNQWMPHIHVDFHEQSYNSPYYFAPAAEPYHEVITDFQREFQETVGRNNAFYFDREGWFYFTKERFDLFYPSYGDTYPTYNGAIGMTYEQGGGGRAGLGVITANGDTLTLKDRIAHHRTTGLSTVEVASQNATRLNAEFQKFYRPKNYKYKSYVLKGNADKINALTNLLDKHEVAYGFATGASAKGYRYSSSRNGSMAIDGKTLVVSTNQKKGTLVKVLFEPNAKLSDSLTYDITAWSLPHAYGLEALASEGIVRAASGTSASVSNDPLDENAYAFLAEWNSMKDARFLAELLKAGVKVRHAIKPFRLEGKKYERGTLIITRGDNTQKKDFLSILQKQAETHNKVLTGTQTGFVENGKDFGSGYVRMIPKVKVGIVTGEPTSTLRYGEIWHFMEQQLGYPFAALDAKYLKGVDLNKYDVLVMPGGYGYRDLVDKDFLEKLKSWVSSGGRLIAMGGAIRSIGVDEGFNIKTRKNEAEASDTEVVPYESTPRERMKNQITGAIFKAQVDPTHPLAFGYGDTYFTLKLGADTYEYLNSGTAVYLDGDTKPVAGFAGSEAQKKLDKTLIFGVENRGRGQVVYLVDNPLFRGFWENGKLFFANALFMVN
ncbi:MAG: zinc carboxypeptidase, partial [Eudoraea sp.]|nr:zinc carboxypeptidase [Eudoraea sp.]NNK31238.1 zinc carboxypeptidase [Flavobacteriaceae bacterium]